MPNQGVTSLQRSWTFFEPHRHRPHHKHVRVPAPNTYRKQLEYCRQMYSDLHLHDSSKFDQLPTILNTRSVSISPLFYARSAPGTAGPWSVSNISSPVRQTSTCPQTRLSSSKTEERKSRHSRMSSAVTLTENGEQRKRRVDPVVLSDYLRTHGYGEPIMRKLVTDPNNSRLPRGYKPPGMLPNNPSDREKIKGKARLDYEMANMKAMAFCERQNSMKAFRTASANMRNRDVQFVEDEMRDQVHRGIDEVDDDTDSVVFMAMTREELEEKVIAWMVEVDQSLGHSVHVK